MIYVRERDRRVDGEKIGFISIATKRKVGFAASPKVP
jgi:hypothetical protein